MNRIQLCCILFCVRVTQRVVRRRYTHTLASQACVFCPMARAISKRLPAYPSKKYEDRRLRTHCMERTNKRIQRHRSSAGPSIPPLSRAFNLVYPCSCWIDPSKMARHRDRRQRQPCRLQTNRRALFLFRRCRTDPIRPVRGSGIL